MSNFLYSAISKIAQAAASQRNRPRRVIVRGGIATIMGGRMEVVRRVVGVPTGQYKVDKDGYVSVYDDVAGHYVVNTGLSSAQEERIRRLTRS
jgi:hypothetical protein